MTKGEKLFLTAYHAFDYSKGHFAHLRQFDVILNYFKVHADLKGYISDEVPLEEGSQLGVLMLDLYEGFNNKNVAKVVEEYLHKYELYELLAEYFRPLSKEAQDILDEFEKEGLYKN